MRFHCDRCKTRYSIADDKVRGKILKIRCKNCSTVITVREEGASPAASGPIQAAAAAPARPGRGTIELTAIAPPSPGATARLPEDDGEPTRISPPVGLPAPDAPREEWYLSRDGDQVGPLSLEQARRRLASRKPGDDMYAWREDFAEWLPVDSVPELRPAAPPPLPPAPIFAAPAVAEDPFAGVAGVRLPPAPVVEDNFDFQIGEASRVVRAPVQVGRGTGRAPVPAQVPKNGTARTPSIPGTIPAIERPAASQSLAAMPRRRSHLPLYLGAGALAVAATLIAIFVATRKSDRGEQSSARRGSGFADDFYKGKKPPPVTPAPEAKPVAEPAPPPPEARPRPIPPRPRPTPVATNTTTTTRSAPEGSGKVDSFGEESASGSLSPDDIRSAYLANEVVMKRCYERALKQDPGLSITRLEVKLTIAPSGIVDRVSVPQQSSALGSCVAQAIRGWRFRKTASEFTTEFPIIFAKRG